MMVTKQSIEEALASDRPIPRSVVRGWIQASSAIDVDARLYELIQKAWTRIEPPLESDDMCTLVERYLLACIREDRRDEEVLTRYDAAHELVPWFDLLASTSGPR